MRGKSLALLGLALGCGLVASIGITQVMAKRGSDSASGETVSVFVVTKDVDLGVFLSADLLRPEQWPADSVPAGAVSRMEDLEGRRTKTRLFAGEPILENKLFRKGANYAGPDALVPKGHRVVSVKVDLSSGNAGMLLPGSRVDVLVFLTRNNSKEVSDTSVRTVLQDIQVFAVNDVVSLDAKDQDATKSIAAKTVSLLVTPDQGAKLMLANEMGKIRLMMRNPEDDALGGAAQSRPSDMFDGASAGDREKETLVEKPKKSVGKSFLDALGGSRRAAPVAPLEVRPTWTMRVLEPGTIKDVVMEEMAGDPANPLGGQKVWRPLNLTAPGSGKNKAKPADEPGAPGSAAAPAPATPAAGTDSSEAKTDAATDEPQESMPLTNP
jgi:pilus assembly protein CpaB